MNIELQASSPSFSPTSPPSSDGTTPRRHRGHEPFQLQIAGVDLNFQAVVTDDPKPTGRDLIDAAGFHPVEDHIVLQVLRSGDLEDLRLNETVDLREAGVERFIIAKSDRTYRFVLVDKDFEWPAAPINGITLKRMGNQKPEAVAVFLERRDEADREIGDHEYVDLSTPGVERFYFAPVKQTVDIIVNKRSVRIAKGERTGLEIKQAAIQAGLSIESSFVLSLHTEHGQTKIIGDTDSVRVHDGQRFTAVADDDVS